MGGIIGLLDRARAAGLSITTDGDRIIVCGPRRADALARELIAHKVEVMAELAALALVEAAPAATPSRDDQAKPAEAATEPDPCPWRKVLPGWPVEWRERWGRRANELAESGIRWPDDEAKAFVEVLAERERNPIPPPTEAEPALRPVRSTVPRPRDDQAWLSLTTADRPDNRPGIVVPYDTNPESRPTT
jgi:hypothetical protein